MVPLIDVIRYYAEERRAVGARRGRRRRAICNTAGTGIANRNGGGARAKNYGVSDVFLTFSLSMFGVARQSIAARKSVTRWKRKAALFCVGFALCATILVITAVARQGAVNAAATGAAAAVNSS